MISDEEIEKAVNHHVAQCFTRDQSAWIKGARWARDEIKERQWREELKPVEITEEEFEERFRDRWYERKNEKQRGVPLSRLPEWRREDVTQHTLLCRLEEVIMAYDREREKCTK